jgi:ATP-binding cassette, subfamily B, bacterial HlyB/CyaB
LSSPDQSTGAPGPGGQRPPGPLSAVPPSAEAAGEQARDATSGAGRREPPSPLELRLRAMTAAARHHGTELDRDDLRVPPGESPSPAVLVDWVRAAGLWAKAVRLRWRHLMDMTAGGPLVLLLNDGTAALMVRADAARSVVWLRDPQATSDDQAVPVDELRLSQVWGGEAILIRRERGVTFENEPFSFAWIARMVWIEKSVLRDVVLGSVVLSILAIAPPILVMVVIDKVVTYQSMSTLTLIALFLAAAALYETYLGYIRRRLIQIVATRLDTKLSLHVFRRLLGLPIDFFERNQTGAILYKLQQVSKIRDFLTGRLLTTMLDFVTLTVMLPVLFWISVPLTWMVIGAAGMICLIIIIFLPAVRSAFGKWVDAEVQRNNIMVETVHGIRTVKALALEPQQREIWDERVAIASARKQDLGNVSNWPQTLTVPFENFMNRGVLLIGAYFVVSGDIVISTGSLMAFMMLSGRVSQPLVSTARLVEDLEETRTAVSLAASVLNNKPETLNPGAGLRPRFEGAISFNRVEFTYPGSRNAALQDISFEVPAGTMLGLVGRSGSGKSTITRLLQGINRDYEGSIKLDGVDLREINLAHLRRSFGVVLQENFLFRGTIRENLLAGRPGLTITDVVRAARLAGAEEFIERLPQGYETWIEEGSPNLSGGQRQRLAIARALIHDPRLLILDEATSALDPESEALVNANIHRIAHGRSMLIVSHRLSSLVDCHQILVLDQGRVVDIGPHKDLLERCSVYRQLWLQQHRHMDMTGKPAGPKPVLAQGD